MSDVHSGKCAGIRGIAIVKKLRIRKINGVQWKANKIMFWALKHLFGYGITVNGLEHVEKDKTALFAFKHQSKMDGPLLYYIFPRECFFLGAPMYFRNPVLRIIYENSGFVPFGPETYRTFLKTINTDGWWAYAPEGKRINGTVGEDIHPELLIKAAENGAKPYLVGIDYEGGHFWRPFNRVTVTIEPYNPLGKPDTEVVANIKEGLSRLSGLPAYRR